MKTKVYYVAIKAFEEWTKNPNPKKAIKMLFRGKHIDKVENYKAVRLIEITMPLDDTAEDDVIYTEDGAYSVTGRAEAKHYDKEEVLDFLNSRKEGYGGEKWPL